MTESLNTSTINSSQEGKENLAIKVLLAEDDEILLSFSTMMLEHMGCAVEAVRNGQLLKERLDTSKPGEFGLVVTDNSMPVMNGTDVLKWIRSDKRFDQLPVILNSGSVDDRMRKTVENLNAIYLAKPSKPKDFQAAVRKAVLR